MGDVGQNNGAAVVQYVIEIDRSKHSEHASFVDAIKQGLLLREQNPEAKIKVRDLSELAATEHRAAA